MYENIIIQHKIN